MRIVSLLPAATEIVAALGADDEIVGVTHACDSAETVRERPRVTRSAVDGDAPPGEIDAAVRDLMGLGAPIFALDESRIAALAPDVLLTQALCDVCAVSEHDVRALADRLGGVRVATLGGTTLAGVCDDVARVGAAIGREAQAARLVASMQARLDAIARSTDGSARRPRVALVEWTAPVYLAGHWGPEMVRLAGGVAVLAAEGAHSTTASLDALAAAEPDVVVIAPCGYGLARAVDEARAVQADPAWAWLRGRTVWALDGNAVLSRPGPRLVAGVAALAELLGGRSPDPAVAQRVA